MRRYLKITFVVLALVGIGGFAFFEARTLLYGPQLSLESPKNGATYTEELLEISGTAKNIAFISMNGLQIYTNQQGNFAEPFLLAPGYNIITVAARDRFNRTIEKKFEVVYVPPNGAKPFSPNISATTTTEVSIDTSEKPDNNGTTSIDTQ